MTSAASNINHPGPPPAIQEPVASSPPSKRDLRSWWKSFKLQPKHQAEQQVAEQKPNGIFGVPLRQSITYANVAISLIDENGQSYIYGYVPIVVAKCGVFLKETATSVPGIFRLSGSEKRIKDLKTIFDSPDRYGKGLDWEGYNVHDAANVLRRYLNDLPEPVVPLELYEKFRDPLRGATKQAVGDAEGPQFVDNFDEKAAIVKYQHLITELPPLNRQLLLYILDLLAVFAAKSDENLMTSHNLAAIFQPGMLSHPMHAMAPDEYRLNQCVIIFLIENQDHFLIGMQGTGTDETTKQEIERGSTVTAGAVPRRKSGLGRSASNASAGTASLRKDGVRRHRSVSSRNSKHEGDVTPNSPSLQMTQITPTTGGSIGRSNTVPSKRSPALMGGKFKNVSPGPGSPAHRETPSQPPIEEIATPPEQDNLLAPPVTSSPAPASPSPASRGADLLEVPGEVASTPSKERGIAGIFNRSTSGQEPGDKRTPRKLQKKKLPGSLNPSAQSSTASLSGHPSPRDELAVSPLDFAQPVPIMEETPHQVEQHAQQAPQTEEQPQQAAQQPPTMTQQNSDLSSEPTPRASQIPSTNTLHPEAVLRGKKSPPTSLHSSFNEGSEVDRSVVDARRSADVPRGDQQEADKEKKARWRLSRSRDKDFNSGDLAPPMRENIGLNHAADVSSTSIGSGSNAPRKSFTNESSNPTLSGTEATVHDEDKERESKGLFGRIRNKYRDVKERTKSPPANDGHGNLTPRIIDAKPMRSEEFAKSTPPKPQEAQPAVGQAPVQSPPPAQSATIQPVQSPPPAQPAAVAAPTESVQDQGASAQAPPPTQATVPTAEPKTPTTAQAPVTQFASPEQPISTPTQAPAAAEPPRPPQSPPSMIELANAPPVKPAAITSEQQK